MMKGSKGAPRAQQSGVALAMVVWFIAGMAVLVAGIVSLARTDTRMAQLHMAGAQSTAAADGAINLLMADLLEGRFAPQEQPLIQGRYELGELLVSVVAVPAALLVDVNAASPEVLERTLIAAGAAGSAGARRMTDAIVQWREARPAVGTGKGRFKTLEDVVQVEGVNRAAWDALREYIVAVPSVRDSVRVGLYAVDQTLDTLAMLSPRERIGHPDLLASVPADTSRVQRRGGDYRVDAMVRLGDRTWLRRRWVSSGGGNGGFPWRFLRTEPARIVAGSGRSGA